MEWISVKDRLPEIGRTVLTLSKYGHVFDRCLTVHSGDVKIFSPDGLYPGRDITHWMPLPDPPEIVKED